MAKESIKRYKTPSGVDKWRVNEYWGIHPDTGREVTARKQGFELKRDAIAWRDEEMARLNANMGDNRGRTITMHQLIGEWMETYENSGLQPSSVRYTRTIVDLYIKPAVGQYHVHRLNAMHIQDAVRSMSRVRKDYTKAGTITGRILNEAIREGLITNNPADYVDYSGMHRNHPSWGQVDKDNYYTSEQMNIVLRIMKEHFHYKRWVFFSTLYHMGLRKSEALALFIEDVNVVNNRITVDKSVVMDDNNISNMQWGTKTSAVNPNMETELPIPHELRKILYEYKTQRAVEQDIVDDNRYLFTSSKSGNKHLSSNIPNLWLMEFYDKHMDKLEEAGVTHKISPHGFRHSCASNMFRQGYNPKQVQVFLRHANIETTMNVYTHVTPDDIEDAMDELYTRMGN